MTVTVLQPTPGIDTYLSDAAPTVNYNTSNFLRIGEDTAGNNYYHTAIKFDLSSITPTDTINSVILTFTIYANDAIHTSTLSVYRLLRNWVLNQATWYIWKTSNNWGTAGAVAATDIDLTFGALGSVATGVGDTGLRNITLNAAEFKKLIDGTNPNYGFLCKSLENFAQDDDYYYYSGDQTLDAAKRPYLTIDHVAGGSQPIKQLMGAGH